MLSHRKGPRVYLIVSFFVVICAVQTATAWDMIPPAESVKNATDEFNQAWRLEASQKFSEIRNTGSNNIIAYTIMVFLIVTLIVVFHLMVKLNHLDRIIISVRPDMLASCTRIWLISRWGFRY